MKLLMAGINYKNNSVSQREKLSFTDEKISEICRSICKSENIYGSIIISTCNRTEIYISCDDLNDIMADEILLKHSGIDNFDGIFEKKEDINVVYHIIELACGLKSQIVGEGQIITQINSALEISRKNKCTDSFLNTLFRIAVSAGKCAMTNINVSNVPVSSAYAAVNFISKKYNKLSSKKCVVIGNGKMGQIVQKLLVRKGCDVFVTLRSYKHGNNNVIKGCKTIQYNERYDFINDSDFVVSATKSPHYTITYDKFLALKKKPEIIIDLAVPRDVEPKINEICDCFNIDELGFETKINHKELEEVHSIIERFVKAFIQWKNYKLSLENINFVKDIIYARIIKSYNVNKNYDYKSVNDIISMTVDKTVDMILGGMKENVFPDIIKECGRKIEGRARL